MSLSEIRPLETDSLMIYPEQAPKQYTQEQIRTYERRLENKFDIFTDPDYMAWLTEDHPEALPDNSGLSSNWEFEDTHELDTHSNFYCFDLPSGQFRLLRDEVDCTTTIEVFPPPCSPIQDNPVSLVPDDETLSPPHSAAGDDPLLSVPAAVTPPPPPLPDGEDRLPSVPAAETLSLVSGVEVSASGTEGGGSSPASERSGGEASAGVTGGIGSSLETERGEGKVSGISSDKATSMPTTSTPRRDTSSISEFLTLPTLKASKKGKRGGSRGIARVLTSAESLAFIEEKERKKKEELDAKEKRKQEREEKKIAKEAEKQRKAQEREQKMRS